MLSKATIAFSILAVCVLGLTLKGEAVTESSNQLDERALIEWEKDRAERMDSLVRALFNGDNDTKIRAVYLLGLYRYREAAGTLSRYIDLESDERERIKKLPRWGQYPTVEALIRIGKPSIPFMLRILKNSESPHRRALATRVIFYIEGEGNGRLIVDEAIAESNDPAEKERLQQSLPLIRGGEYLRPEEL